MRPLVVAAVQQGVQVGLQGLDALEQLLVHDRSEKLLEDGAVEAFGSLPSGGPRADPGDAIGPWRADLGLPVLDVPPVRLSPAAGQAVERQVELAGVPLGAAELAALVGERR